MTLSTTLVLLAMLSAVAVVCGWRGARPPDVTRGPRLTPYRLIMVTAVALVLILLVHLVNLLGVSTGR